jgi:hypothetical protein
MLKDMALMAMLPEALLSCHGPSNQSDAFFTIASYRTCQLPSWNAEDRCRRSLIACVQENLGTEYSSPEGQLRCRAGLNSCGLRTESFSSLSTCRKSDSAVFLSRVQLAIGQSHCGNSSYLQSDKAKAVQEMSTRATFGMGRRCPKAGERDSCQPCTLSTASKFPESCKVSGTTTIHHVKSEMIVRSQRPRTIAGPFTW